jgi:hypothetical protein
MLPECVCILRIYGDTECWRKKLALCRYILYESKHVHFQVNYESKHVIDFGFGFFTLENQCEPLNLGGFIKIM